MSENVMARLVDGSTTRSIGTVAPMRLGLFAGTGMSGRDERHLADLGCDSFTRAFGIGFRQLNHQFGADFGFIPRNARQRDVGL